LCEPLCVPAQRHEARHGLRAPITATFTDRSALNARPTVTWLRADDVSLNDNTRVVFPYFGLLIAPLLWYMNVGTHCRIRVISAHNFTG
jgi:hypothetical protein